MTKKKQTRPTELWETLLQTPNTYDALWDIYSADFLNPFAWRFNRDPHPAELTKGVMQTARAYLYGKWVKEVERGKWLQYSGVHLVSAGMASRKLSGALAQLSKSRPAVEAIQQKLGNGIIDGKRQHARGSYKSALRRAGPAAQLLMIQELAASLEEAIAELISLPEEFDEEKDAKPMALAFPDLANAQASRPLPKNYPVEVAAQTFKPIWEEHSTLPYRRGRYRHEIGGYDCKAGEALHAIIHRLDSSVAPSLAGTAIENIKLT